MKYLRVKVLSVGDTETGKSCLIKRYCEKRFISKYLPTIGVDFGVTNIDVDNKDLKVNLFDLSGHAAFKEVLFSFYLISLLFVMKSYRDLIFDNII